MRQRFGLWRDGRVGGRLRPWLAVAALLGAVGYYAATPYYALYQLGQAIRHGRAHPLEKLVAWEDVREGLKEDLCDLVLDDASADPSALPPFGAGFVRGMTGNMIDSTVTPRVLATLVPPDRAAAGAPSLAEDEQPRITWAFFDGPTSFLVVLHTPHDETAPIRIRMRFQEGRWRVTRAWLPPELLARAGTRT